MPTWFPTFTNLAPAALAAMLAIPLLVLLYFLKLRRRPAEVPSTLLWKKAITDLQVNSPFQRLRRNLLLFLQLLLLALVILALARPITHFRAGRQDHRHPHRQLRLHVRHRRRRRRAYPAGRSQAAGQ